MKEFIVIYHAPIDMMKQAESTSPEDRNKSMEEWMKWAADCGEKLVDMGTPLDGGVKLKTDGSSNPSDKSVVGFSVLKADSMDEAKSLMKGHPHLGWDASCDIEIHEKMPLPGQ